MTANSVSQRTGPEGLRRRRHCGQAPRSEGCAPRARHVTFHETGQARTHYERRRRFLKHVNGVRIQYKHFLLKLTGSDPDLSSMRQKYILKLNNYKLQNKTENGAEWTLHSQLRTQLRRARQTRLCSVSWTHLCCGRLPADVKYSDHWTRRSPGSRRPVHRNRSR